MSALLAILAVATILYFLPALVAGTRQHPSRAGILVLNIFLGWTFLFWVLALTWAFSGENRAKQRRHFERSTALRRRPDAAIADQSWRSEEAQREYEDPVDRNRPYR